MKRLQFRAAAAVLAASLTLSTLFAGAQPTPTVTGTPATEPTPEDRGGHRTTTVTPSATDRYPNCTIVYEPPRMVQSMATIRIPAGRRFRVGVSKALMSNTCTGTRICQSEGNGEYCCFARSDGDAIREEFDVHVNTDMLRVVDKSRGNAGADYMPEFLALQPGPTTIFVTGYSTNSEYVEDSAFKRPLSELRFDVEIVPAELASEPDATVASIRIGEACAPQTIHNLTLVYWEKHFESIEGIRHEEVVPELPGPTTLNFKVLPGFATGTREIHARYRLGSPTAGETSVQFAMIFYGEDEPAPSPSATVPPTISATPSQSPMATISPTATSATPTEATPMPSATPTATASPLPTSTPDPEAGVAEMLVALAAPHKGADRNGDGVLDAADAVAP